MTKRTLALMFLVSLFMPLMMIGMNTGEHVPVRAFQDPTPTPLAVDAPVMGAFDPDAIAQIDLSALPLVPPISRFALTVYRNGLARGNDPRAFVKVGDCMTDNPYFLIPIGEGDYALGDYDYLEPVIAQFIQDDLNSFARRSQAAAGGFNAASVLDAIWTNPEFCEAGESPLTCEFRHLRPSIALIMYGTNDVQYLTAEQFDFFLRALVVETIRNGTLPVLSTFPHRPEFPEKTLAFNRITARVALDYDLPLINLWLALAPLPDQGVNLEDPTHMTIPPSGAVCYFVDENMQAGFTVRNLLTLQTLDAILQAAGEE